MPIPIPQPQPVQPVTTQPYWLREPQNWAVEQERMRHAQAIFALGEWAMFFLMWQVLDYEAGLVGRCTVCYPSGNALAKASADVYNQPTRNKCPSCFGTTFEGGYRARIIRPVIFGDTDEDERVNKRGTTHPDDVAVETTWDFRVFAGDFVVRPDNSRWQLSAPTRVTLRSGFEYPDQKRTSLTYNNIRAMYEEPTTVAYTLPPTDRAAIGPILNTPVHYPTDFSAHEVIRAPLIPAQGG
jgi:hypothetical protein